MKLLTYTTLYPNRVQERHGIFIENRLRQLIKHTNIESHVIAPVPWFPFKSNKFGIYSEYARVDRSEVRHNISIDHPRYPVIPKFGMNVAPSLLSRFSKNSFRKAIKKLGGIDLIDAHYLYPDGVAAAKLADYFGLPFVISARGTDVNVIAEFPVPRRMILAAANRAAAIITVSEALREKLLFMGVHEDKVVTLRNGVDLDLFSPKDRGLSRIHFGCKGFVIVSAGNLIELKGHHLVIAALQKFTDAMLFVVGKGKQEGELKSLANKLNVSDRVKFISNLPQVELSMLYGAADVTVLASSREGMPNVVLESLACGTPVIATNVGGVPEVLVSNELGTILVSRTKESLISAFGDLRANYPDRERIRTYAENLGWTSIIKRQFELYQKIVCHA